MKSEPILVLMKRIVPCRKRSFYWLFSLIFFVGSIAPILHHHSSTQLMKGFHEKSELRFSIEFVDEDGGQCALCWVAQHRAPHLVTATDIETLSPVVCGCSLVKEDQPGPNTNALSFAPKNSPPQLNFA